MPINDLPKQYLPIFKNIQGPKLILAFLSIAGIKEVPGAKSNPEIMRWAKVIGVEKDYNNDGVAWCGLEMGYLCHLVDKPIVPAPLWALNWLGWGVAVPKGKEMFGDVLVFNRYDSKGKLIGGHVGLYVAEDKYYFHVAGGNESDTSTIVRIKKDRLAGCRRPTYINQPKEVRKIWVDGSGNISDNEA